MIVFSDIYKRILTLCHEFHTVNKPNSSGNLDLITFHVIQHNGSMESMVEMCDQIFTIDQVKPVRKSPDAFSWLHRVMNNFAIFPQRSLENFHSIFC